MDLGVGDCESLFIVLVMPITENLLILILYLNNPLPPPTSPILHRHKINPQAHQPQPNPHNQQLLIPLKMREPDHLPLNLVNIRIVR